MLKSLVWKLQFLFYSLEGCFNIIRRRPPLSYRAWRWCGESHDSKHLNTLFGLIVYRLRTDPEFTEQLRQELADSPSQYSRLGDALTLNRLSWLITGCLPQEAQAALVPSIGGDNAPRD